MEMGCTLTQLIASRVRLISETPKLEYGVRLRSPVLQKQRTSFSPCPRADRGTAVHLCQCGDNEEMEEDSHIMASL